LARGNSGRRERIRRRIKASKWVKLAERSEFRSSDPEWPGSVPFGERGKGAHSRWGNQASARKRGRRGNQRQ